MSNFLLPYEKDLTTALENAEKVINSKVLSQSMRSMYETERTLNECQSFIMQMRIDQKAMAPSNRKKYLKTRIATYNQKYFGMEQKFKKIQLNFSNGDTPDDDDDMQLKDFGNSSSDEDTQDKSLLDASCEMDFETASLNDKEMQVEGGSKSKKKKYKAKNLTDTEKQIKKQNDMIQQALKMSMNTHQLSQQANVELRSQRDQIINVVNMVRDLGMDLFSAEKLASDINYRRFLNILMLYLLIFLL